MIGVCSSRVRVTLVAVLLMVACFSGVAAADHDEDDEESEDDGDTVIDIDLDEVVESIEGLSDDFGDFVSNFDEEVKNAVIEAVFMPFKRVAEYLIEVTAGVLVTTPSVASNSAVQEIHNQTLIITYLIATIGFMAAGLLYMVGPLLGVSYVEVRLILPRMMMALIFAAVSLPILELAVKFTDALSTAFAPSQLDLAVQQMAGLRVSLVLVWFIQASLLLALAALFLIRDIYILFGAAISPLLALMWSLPKTKKYADEFIGAWYAALIIAPLDLLVLKLAIALLEAPGSGLEAVANWMFGIATFTLLLIIPYQVWSVSGRAVSYAGMVAASAARRTSSNADQRSDGSDDDRTRKRNRRPPRRGGRY